MTTNFQRHVDGQLSALRAEGLYRRPRSVDGPQDTHLTVDGQRVLCLCSNNYLGLARHPALSAAVRAALDEEGVGSGASAHISGYMQLHRRVEAELASFVGLPAAVLFSTGYACNVGVVQALATRADVIFSDRLNHASLIDGARLSRARVIVYEHGNAGDLERKLRTQRADGAAALILTESLFSMDGDIAPLGALRRLATEFECGLIVDEAHALGVLGPEGRGVCAAGGVQADVLIGTLGKAFGGQGAFAAAASNASELIRNRARSYVFSTAPSPATSAAALAALRLVRDADALRSELLSHSARLRIALGDLGFAVGPGFGPIIPVHVGAADRTMELSRALLERGVFVHGVRPPTVPRGSSRLRVVPMATHSADDIAQAIGAFAEVHR